MRKICSLLLMAFWMFPTQAQELNATVTIDAEQTGQPNYQVLGL